MVKKFINLVLLAVFVCGVSLIPFNELSAKAESPKVANLTQEEIANKFLEIDSKYGVGEELNSEDAKFIKKYAKVAEKESVVKLKPEEQVNTPITTLASAGETFTGRGSNPSGTVAASTLGTYALNIGWINQSYSISMTTAMSKGTASSIKNSYTHTAYGAIGAGGVGKVYSNSDSSSCTSKSSCYSYFSDSYSAIVAYYTTVVKSVVTYSGGSFTISVSGL